LRYWKSEHRFPYLKAAARELLGMTATSGRSERVFSHADKLYPTARNAPILAYESLLFSCLWIELGFTVAL